MTEKNDLLKCLKKMTEMIRQLVKVSAEDDRKEKTTYKSVDRR